MTIISRRESLADEELEQIFGGADNRQAVLAAAHALSSSLYAAGFDAAAFAVSYTAAGLTGGAGGGGSGGVNGRSPPTMG